MYSEFTTVAHDSCRSPRAEGHGEKPDMYRGEVTAARVNDFWKSKFSACVFRGHLFYESRHKDTREKFMSSRHRTNIVSMAQPGGI